MLSQDKASYTTFFSSKTASTFVDCRCGTEEEDCAFVYSHVKHFQQAYTIIITKKVLMRFQQERVLRQKDS